MSDLSHRQLLGFQANAYSMPRRIVLQRNVLYVLYVSAIWRMRI